MSIAAAAPAHTPLDRYAWDEIGAALDAHGWAMLPGLLPATTCAEVAGWYDEASRFRSPRCTAG